MLMTNIEMRTMELACSFFKKASKGKHHVKSFIGETTDDVDKIVNEFISSNGLTDVDIKTTTLGVDRLVYTLLY